MGNPAPAFVADALLGPLDLDRVSVTDVVFVREEMAEKPTTAATSVDGSVADSPVALTSSQPFIPAPPPPKSPLWVANEGYCDSPLPWNSCRRSDYVTPSVTPRWVAESADPTHRGPSTPAVPYAMGDLTFPYAAIAQLSGGAFVHRAAAVATHHWAYAEHVGEPDRRGRHQGRHPGTHGRRSCSARAAPPALSASISARSASTSL
jgi:hypothetical protein